MIRRGADLLFMVASFQALKPGAGNQYAIHGDSAVDRVDVPCGDLLVAPGDLDQRFAADHILDAPEGLPAGDRIHRLDDQVGGRAAVGEDDGRGLRKAVRLIGLQRGRRIARSFEQLREPLGVENRLRAAVAAARVHRVRRVAEQRHAPEAPAPDRIAIDHRVLEHEFRAAQHVRNIQPVEAPVEVVADEVLEAPALVPVVLGPAVLLHLAGPIERLRAVRMIADRIDYKFPGAQRPGPRHARAGEEGLAARHAAPQVDAAEERPSFLRIELTPHRRVESVAGDRDIGAHGRKRLGADRVLEMHRDAALVLVHAPALVGHDYGVRADARADRVVEHGVQVGAMERVVGKLVAGAAPAGLAVDQLAVLVEERELTRLDADARDRFAEPQLEQPAHRVREKIDADPERLELGGGLVYPAGNAAAVQVKREREPADAAAYDRDFQFPSSSKEASRRPIPFPNASAAGASRTLSLSIDPGAGPIAKSGACRMMANYGAAIPRSRAII